MTVLPFRQPEASDAITRPGSLPSFPRHHDGVQEIAYRRAALVPMRRWVLASLERWRWLKPRVEDESERMRRRILAAIVLTDVAAMLIGRKLKATERAAFAEVGRAVFAQLEKEAFDDLADSMADRALNGGGAGYMLLPKLGGAVC